MHSRCNIFNYSRHLCAICRFVMADLFSVVLSILHLTGCVYDFFFSICSHLIVRESRSNVGNIGTGQMPVPSLGRLRLHLSNYVLK